MLEVREGSYAEQMHRKALPRLYTCARSALTSVGAFVFVDQGDVVLFKSDRF